MILRSLKYNDSNGTDESRSVMIYVHTHIARTMACQVDRAP